jgi:hypothetical protein
MDRFDMKDKVWNTYIALKLTNFIGYRY